MIRAEVPLFLILGMGLCGCSAGSATVSGKVTADGKEVTSGGVVLSPVAVEGNFPGKPGVADIRSDGTYLLDLEPGDSGLAQRFIVRFTPPPPHPAPNAPKDLPPEDLPLIAPYQGLIPKQAEVELKPGRNVVDIELVPVQQKKPVEPAPATQ